MKSGRSVCFFSAGVAFFTAVFATRVLTSADATAGKDFDTNLPGVASVDQLSDGSWVCSTGTAAYVSSNLNDWTLVQVRLPADRRVGRCLGGSQKRMFFVASTERLGGDSAIYAVEPGREPTKIRPLPPVARPPAAFCSDSIGAVSTGANIGVTVDGGATWHPTPPLFEAENAQITLIQRAGESRVLVSDGRSLALYEVRHDAGLHQVWRVAVPDETGISTQVPACDPTHVWVGVKRLKLADGEADLEIPKKSVEATLRDVNRVVVVWDNALIVASMRLQKVRALTRNTDGTYVAGRWFPTDGFSVVPTVKPHCLLFGIRGDAYDFDLAADTLTSAPLHVVPPTSKPHELSPAFVKLGQEVSQLGQQLPLAEANAIGERIAKTNGLTGEEQLELMKKEYQLAIDKHKADGTLPPPRQNTFLQLMELGRQLTEKERRDILARAQKMPFATSEQRQLWMKDQYEKLIAKHRADGTLPKMNSENAAPATGAAASSIDPDVLVRQILHLGLQLPEAERKRVWEEARRKESDPTRQREWVKDQFEKLIATHKADGTLPKPKSDAPDPK